MKTPINQTTLRELGFIDYRNIHLSPLDNPRLIYKPMAHNAFIWCEFIQGRIDFFVAAMAEETMMRETFPIGNLETIEELQTIIKVLVTVKDSPQATQDKNDQQV